MKHQVKMAALCAVSLAALVGCQTRITAEKHAEILKPYYGTSGTNLYVRGYERASGGWYATARSPLWATEELKGLSISVTTNGTVSLALDEYHRDLSTNAVTMAHNLVVDFATLAEKTVAAYGSCGATIATAKASAAVKKSIAAYIAKGGSASAATVTCKDGNCTYSDGTVTEVCTDCL